MSRWLKNLNPEQRAAVLHTEGPLLVLAGAGSGKTRVITHRIAHLLEKGVEAENILGVTFTNKAAGEMRERLRAMVGAAARGVMLSTFHSLGLHILRAEAGRKPRAKPFTIFETGDQLSVLRDITRQTRLGKGYDLGAVLTRISNWKNGFVEPKDVKVGEDAYEYDQAAALLYPRYVELLNAYRAVDFDDLICKPTLLLEGCGACRKRWAGRFRYVLVDEYQDTNPAQFRLLHAIAGMHRNVCVVGDDDQSIYGWRGADVRNILQFERDFPGAEVVTLTRNYRSVGSVLEAANRVIAENPERHPKQLEPARGQGPRVKLTITSDAEHEAAWVAQTIRELFDRRRYRFDEIAVLYRSNIQTRDLETELRTNRVPYRMLGGTAYYDRKEVKDLVAYLKLCANPRDEISLRRVINSPPRGIGPRTLEKLSTWAEDHGKSLYQALGHAEEAIGPEDRCAAAVSDFRALIDRNAGRMRRKGNLPAATSKLVEELNLHEELKKSSESAKVLERRLGFVQDFQDGVERFCGRSANPTLQAYLSQLALIDLETDQDDGAADTQVTLSTLHGSKGLEFPVVFLIGLEEGLLPHDRTLNPQVTDAVTGDVAEERRLCYVGMTRAMDELVLSRAKARRVRGKLVDRTPSRFLDALDPASLEIEDLTRQASPEDVDSMMDELRAKLGW
ncbi:MAG: UvrD-helicase domain-containing protein [bacterium]